MGGIPMRTAQSSRPMTRAASDPSPDGIRVNGQFISRMAIAAATRRDRVAVGGMGDIMQSGYTNVYDPIISRDFLEIPQDLTVRWAWYRHFYQHDALVNRAIDLHSTLPVSRISLRPPKGRDKAKNAYVKDFYERMLKRLGLLSHLIAAGREYLLVGNFISYAQDDEETLAPDSDDPYNDYPDDDFATVRDPMTGESREASGEERLEAKRKWYDERFGKRNPEYMGWDKLTLLPIENVHIHSFEFDANTYYEYVPAAMGRHPYMNRPYMGQDNRSQLHAPLRRSVPPELLELYEQVGVMGQPIDLPTDPYEGSAVYHCKRNAADFDELGMSMLDPVLKVLIHKDKLRQLNTLIINRKMTPVRLISGEDLSQRDVEDLRAQIDAAMNTPDFSIVTNYQVNWEEVGAQDRLLETESKNQELDREIMVGLKLYEGLVTGDSTYGGNRVAVEVMNTEYLQFREGVLDRYIEEFILKPVAWKKGFVEVDEFGHAQLLYPTVRFSRLGIRDNDQLYDQLLNLYLQGSLPLAVLLELVNIDVDEAEEGIKEDMLTVRDPKFNDFWSAVLSALSEQIATGTDLGDRLREYLQVNKVEAPAEEMGAMDRFGLASQRPVLPVRDDSERPSPLAKLTVGCHRRRGQVDDRLGRSKGNG